MSISTAIEASAVARAVGIATSYKDMRAGGIMFLPQRIAVIGQGTTAATFSTTKAQHTSAASVGAAYGYGSPLHLAALQLMPINGDGVGSIPVTFYPLDDATGEGVAAAVGGITPSGTIATAGEYRISCGGIISEPFVIGVAMSVEGMCDNIVAAINAVPEMPVIATDNTTDVILTAKWKGASGNDIKVSLVGTAAGGFAVAFTQPTAGLVNPSVAGALAQIGNVWETMILNCLDIADTTALDAFSAFGEGRWGALVRKPCVVFVGDVETTAADAITIPDARKTDRTNAQLVAPGSEDFPCIVAARQLARIAVRANSNPPFDYGGLAATGLTPGADGDQWLYADRDAAVKGGSSTIEVRDGVVSIGDVVTFYHPANDPLPAFRYVVDIVKLQNIIYNIDLIFTAAEWEGAPLIPDFQPTTNRAAKKPKTARAAVGAMADSLGMNAIISDPEYTKDNTVAEINDQNPKRLDMVVPVKLSGNTNIISIDLAFGFYFGTAPVVA